jgi:hypothetical protein
MACHLLYQYFVIFIGHRRIGWDIQTVRGTNTMLIMSLPFDLMYCLPALRKAPVLQLLGKYFYKFWNLANFVLA